MAKATKNSIPPSKWVDRKVIEKACQLLREGSTYRAAFRKAGANEQVAYEHLSNARMGRKSVLTPFLEEIEAAIEDSYTAVLDRVIKEDMNALDTSPESKDGLTLKQRTIGDEVWVSPKDRIIRAVQARAGLNVKGKEERAMYERLQSDRRVMRDPAEFIYAIGERDTVEDVLEGYAEYANAPTPDQCAILKSVAEHDRVIVRSGNALGKSHLLVRLAVWHLLRPGSTTIITAPEARVLKLSIMPRVNALAAKLGIPGRLKQTIRPDENSDEWQLASYSSDTAEGSSGVHPSGSFLIIVDEAQGTTPTLYAALEGMASAKGNKILMLGNPIHLEGPFFDICMDDNNSWQKHRLSALEHPNCIHGRTIYRDAIDRDWVAARKAEWGEGSDNWRTRVLGDFPQVDPEGVHFLSRDQIAKLSTPAGEPSWFKEMGL